MVTLQDFIANWTGKKVGTGQCIALIHQYLNDVYGLTDATLLAQPLAYEIWTNFISTNWNQYFNTVANTLTNIPSPGDIMIIDHDADGAEGAGHICIFVSGDANSFVSFDQNWPTGSLPHLVTHKYLDANNKGVLGWLTPKPQGTFVNAGTFDKLVKESTAFETFVTAGYASVDAINQKLKSYTDQITDLQSQLGKANNKNTELLGEISEYQKLTNQQAAIPTPSADQAIEAIEQAKDVTYDINLVAEDLGTTYPPVKNIRGEITTIKNQLRAAQIELTKQAEINKAFQAASRVLTTSKGVKEKIVCFLQSIHVLQKGS